MAVAPPKPDTLPDPDSLENTTSRPKSRLHDPYLWHKLHSASGIFPIGIFLVQHLIANSYALRGPAAYDTVVKVFGYLPFVLVLEVLLIYIPILYHSIYGFWITAYGQPNLGRYQYGRNWMYFLQRASGVVAFFYIGYHVWHTSFAKYWEQIQHHPNPESVIQYQQMAQNLSSNWVLAIYAVGIIATVFHFTNGLWNFCIRWGITISAHSQRVNQYVCWGLFFVFTFIGLWTAIHLHQDGVRGISTAVPAVKVMTQ